MTRSPKHFNEINLTHQPGVASWSLTILAFFMAIFVITEGLTSIALATPPAQGPVGTGFTYQGLLMDQGSPAEGTYDFRFTLYEDSAGTIQTGTPQTQSALIVSDGHFATILDFGDVFDGNGRWLKVEVHPSGTTAFTALLPLEQITPIPYAMYSEGMDWNDITNIPADLADGDDVDDADNDATNELNSTLVLSGTQLRLGDAGGTLTADLTSLQDGAGTDSQDLSLSGNTLSLTNDGTPVDLSGYLDNTDMLAGLSCGDGQVAQYNSGTWACVTISETDPQVSASTTNSIPQWDGSALVDSIIATNGTNMVGINGAAYTEELNIRTGDSPTLRLEQSGGAFGNYNWDIGGNEANFFIRNGPTNQLPFRIQPGADSNALYIASSNDISLGDNSPAFKLEVNGSAGKPGGGSWSDTSDERLKQNIQPLDGTEALEKILSLKGVSYEWKNPEEHKAGVQVGLIAQELEEVFPAWVEEVEATGKDADLVGRDEKVKAIHFPNDFNAYLVEAIKEQQRQLQALEEQNAQLKALICELKSSAEICND